MKIRAHWLRDVFDDSLSSVDKSCQDLAGKGRPKSCKLDKHSRESESVQYYVAPSLQTRTNIALQMLSHCTVLNVDIKLTSYQEECFYLDLHLKVQISWSGDAMKRLLT